MALRRRVVLSTTALLAATGVLVATHPAAARTAQTATQQTTGFRTATITAADGTAIEANVIEPATAGRHPPSSSSIAGA